MNTKMRGTTFLVNRHRPIKNGFRYDWCISITTPEGDITGKELPEEVRKVLGKPIEKKTRREGDIVTWEYGADHLYDNGNPEGLIEAIEGNGGRVVNRRERDNGSWTVEVKFKVN